MDRSAVAIVIPALNEEGTIAQVVASVLPLGLPIVVDDASTDRTGERAAGAGAQVVRNAANLGYDGALNAGFARAGALRCAYIVTVDADAQHDPGAVRRVLEALEGGAQVVVGVRDRRQRWSERLFAVLASLRFGIRDPLCGLKGYRRAVPEALGHFDSYGSVGTELALFAAARGMALAQVEVRTRPRQGAPRFGGALRANWKILRALALALPRYFLR